jgi:hypothetical protein
MQVPLVFGQLVRQLHQLRSDNRAQPADDPEGHQRGQDDRGDAAQPQPLQLQHQRTQQKRNQHGERQWNQELASKVKNRNRDADG